MMQLRLTERAEEDLSDHFAWFGGYDLLVAERFTTESRKSIELLLQHPALGRIRHFHGRQLRSWRVKGFPKIIIFYSFDPKTLIVHRVLHGQRDIQAELTRGIVAGSSEIQ